MDDLVVMALFRHGLTEANQRHAYLGWTDSPLCEKVPRASCNYEHLFSSDLGRCLETAKMMFPDSSAEMLSEFREMNFGLWEGKTYEELKDDLDYQNWLSAPFSFKPPNGESFTEFSERVEHGFLKVMERIMASTVRKAAIVTHGGVIRYLLTKYAPEKKDFWAWKVAHGQGFELVWKLDDLRSGDRCTLLREVPLMENLNG
ncbi:histidine phosphatase family protein [Bacillus sp. FJAT-49705]|uniref:Histidine phosphatase family protein n=1 Tax=Cytobacillus citreus TaxID=2833586 RepID=A0ABS5P074_9BACI|nr:histidine phosphatase family protein [Cytobacillus citreus]MBS4192544.1 histidine phosphatase family protein [Cytobacillus citreus]